MLFAKIRNAVGPAVGNGPERGDPVRIFTKVETLTNQAAGRTLSQASQPSMRTRIWKQIKKVALLPIRRFVLNYFRTRGATFNAVITLNLDPIRRAQQLERTERKLDQRKIDNPYALPNEVNEFDLY